MLVWIYFEVKSSRFSDYVEHEWKRGDKDDPKISDLNNNKDGIAIYWVGENCGRSTSWGVGEFLGCQFYTFNFEMAC